MNQIVPFIMEHWNEIATIYILFYVFMKGIRDVIDKTPETDDNLFEKAVTFLKKSGALFTTGQRPKIGDK